MLYCIVSYHITLYHITLYYIIVAGGEAFSHVRNTYSTAQQVVIVMFYTNASAIQDAKPKLIMQDVAE